MWVTVSELTNCKGFPKTERGCRKTLDKLAKENPDIRRKKEGSKAFEYNSLYFPVELQVHINQHFSVDIVNKKPKLPVMRSVVLTELTEKQRQAADARMMLVAYILQLEQVQPRYKAIKFFCQQAKQHLLSPELMQLVAKANNKKGQSRVIGERTLNQWVLDYEKAGTPEERLKALAPMQRVAKKAEDIAWLPDFLAEYRQTNGINVAEAYGYFSQRWQERFVDQPLMLERLPSIDRVRRALAKLPRHIKEIGRKTGSELRALGVCGKRQLSLPEPIKKCK